MTFDEYLNRCSQDPWLDAKNWWSKKYGEKQDICVVSDPEKKKSNFTMETPASPNDQS